METRAIAIAFFYAFGTVVGGVGGPLLFGALIASGKPSDVFVGYIIGAVLMIAAGLVEVALGVEAAGRDLEDIAAPLSAQEAEEQETAEAADPLTVGGTSETRAREHGRPVGPTVIEPGDVVNRAEFEHGGWHPRPTRERSTTEVKTGA
jgi:hypothetical protein